MKKLATILLATVVMFGGIAAEKRAEAAYLAIPDINSTVPNLSQSYDWLIGYFFWYLNNTQPDFRVNSVQVCYTYSRGDWLPHANVHFKTENIGGNLGITSASRLTYSIDVGKGIYGLLDYSAAPYWGQPLDLSQSQDITNRWAPNVGTVQIEIWKNSSLPELNYTNNVSKWYVDPADYGNDYNLNGCYDLVEYK